MTSDADPGREKLDAVIAEYLQAVKAGTAPSREALLAQYPELAEQLRAFFDQLDQQQPVDSDATDAPSEDRTIPPTDAPTDDATLRPSNGTIEIGTRVRYFGDYELLEEIARGGMGVVYKAKQVSLNRIVALKMILAGQLASDEDVQRFHAEAEAAANLDHPGIVPIHEVGVHDGQHYFSMGYVEGSSLAERIADGPLPPREAAELTKKVAEAVAYAHEHGVIHRDLKPANVLLDEHGQPRVTDFGLAKRIQADSDLTRSGQILGTPSYMPPEQASGKIDDIKETADVYSLGAILYCLLTGRPPFQADNQLDTLLQVLEQEPVSPMLLNPKVPRDLATVCLKCLRKDMGRRYASADEIIDDLRRWLNNEPIVARPVSRAEKILLWCKRKPGTAASIAAITATLIASLLVVGLQRRTSDQNRAETLVDAVLTAPAEAVPYAIVSLEPLRAYALPVLRERFNDSSMEYVQRLHAAYALSRFGQVEQALLINGIAKAPASECANIISALQPVGTDAARSIRQLWKAETDLPTKVRLAVVALHLGDSAPAAEMTRWENRPDRSQRTAFIEGFSLWNGDLRALAESAKELADPALRSAVCLGIGSLPQEKRTEDVKHAWIPVFVAWHRETPDAGTHSTSSWALREWGNSPPDIPPGDMNRAGFDWEKTQMGLTLLRIPKGTFVRRSLHDQDAQGQTVHISEFLLSDCEVPVKLFRQFIDDGGYKEQYRGETLLDWRGHTKTVSPTDDHPVQMVSWYDAVMFCNWLSRREGRQACYEKTGGKEKVGLSTGEEYDAWRLIEGVIGYRLPTAGEWEYACRAGTVTNFAFGDDQSPLRSYGVYSATRAEPTGSKLCSAWGLFDMHGNVREWCWDWHAEYGTVEQVDPMGPTRGSSRVNCGGGWFGKANVCRSEYRQGDSPATLDNRLGFRVAMDVPGKTAEISDKPGR